MIRFFGFLLGVALAAAIILSVYRVAPSPTLAAQDRPEDVPEEFVRAAPRQVADGAAEDRASPIIPAGDPAEPTAEPVAKAQQVGSPATESAPEHEQSVARVAEQLPPFAETPEPVPSTPSDPGLTPEGESQWFAFWQPFRSELSAAGFRQRLERVTGLDYRVVEIAPGNYQVAFAYLDEEDRLRSLAEIEAATGLALTRVSF